MLSLTEPVSSLSAEGAAGNRSARQALEDVRATAREQLEAAFQIHVQRVEEELAKGWREHIALAVEERFAEIARFVEEEAERRSQARLDSELEEASARGGREASRRLAERLNQAARRLRQANDAGEWMRVLLDASLQFCDRALLFRVAGDSIKLERAARDASATMSGLGAIPLQAVPAFRNVIESRDTVIALCSAEEVSPALAGTLAPPDGKLALFPVTIRGKVAAILCAVGGGDAADFNALELVAALAASALEARPPSPDGTPGGFVLISGAPRPGAFQLPPWPRLSREDQDFHLKAQRFARVRVAELRLYHSQSVKDGRAAGDLYARLKHEIDSGREAFRTQFMDVGPSMVDYFHLELVRTLANDDETLLGSDYPGPLV
jgi:hypothetical protein